MGAEVVSLVVGGTPYTAWTSMNVKGSAQSAEISFEVVAADEAPDLLSAAWLFEPGTACELQANGDLLAAGFINDLSIDLDAEQHEMRVGGRSKGQDAHDCSVKHDSFEWRKKTVLDIAKDTGVQVAFDADVPLKTIEKVRANVGEKVFTHLDRIARAEGLFLTAQPDGSVLITKHGKKRHAGAIVEGRNLLRGTSSFSDRERFSDINVKGQLPSGTGNAALHPEAWETDDGARPGRTLVVMPERTTDKATAKSRAEHIKRTRQGLSVKAEITVQGFRDEAGALWRAGYLVFVESPFLRLSQDMAIDDYEFSQDESGSVTKLSLVDPRALGAKKAGKSRSADVWGEGFE